MKRPHPLFELLDRVCELFVVVIALYLAAEVLLAFTDGAVKALVNR